MINTLSDSDIQRIVERVTAILLARQNACYQVCAADLSQPLPENAFVYHSCLNVTHIDAAFLKALAQFRTSHAGVAQLLRLFSDGMAVTLTLSRALMSLVPVAALHHLPVSWQLESGEALALIDGHVISYADVCACHAGYALFAPHAIVTMLAKETLIAHKVNWLLTENTLCN